MGNLAIRRFAHFEGPIDEFLSLPGRTRRLEGSEADQERAYSHSLLNPENSFHRNATSMNFLAMRGDKPVGRLTAFHNRLLRAARGRVGLIGLFSCDDDLEVARGMINMAASWMQGQGLTLIRGPMDGDVWHRWRFMTHGFDTTTFPAEPRHPEYYADLLMHSGFAPVRSYCTKTILDPWTQMDRFQPAMQANQQRGITVENIRNQDINSLLGELHDVYVNSMTAMWSSTSAPIEEFTAVFNRHMDFINPEYVMLARDSSGGAVGLGIAVCSPEDTVNLLTVVALPSQAGMMLGQLIAGEIYKQGLEQGKKVFQHCMLDPFSPAQRWDHGLAEVTREYMLYERPI